MVYGNDANAKGNRESSVGDERKNISCLRVRCTNIIIIFIIAEDAMAINRFCDFFGFIAVNRRWRDKPPRREAGSGPIRSVERKREVQSLIRFLEHPVIRRSYITGEFDLIRRPAPVHFFSRNRRRRRHRLQTILVRVYASCGI